jgi:signal transduction histidine kinase
VLSNLLNNAAKYTEVGGRIGLVVVHEDGEVVFRVSDNGIGIAPEMLSRIFDLFTQAERTIHRSQGGLGVGLTLVRQLVEMHGGTVSVHSEGPNRGSEFVVRLPALAPPSATAGPAELALSHLSCGSPGGA